ASGDQILMFRGTNSTTPSAFICGVSTTSWLTTGSSSSNTSYLPSDLTLNISGITFTGHQDNGYYNGTQIGSIATLKALVNNGSNWVRSTSLQAAPTFSFDLNSTTTTISASATVQNLSLEASEKFVIGANTLTINGTISGAGTIQGSSSSNLTITGTSGSINFDQTTPGTTNVLRNLTISGSSTTTLANALNITGGATPGIVTVGTGATLNTAGNLTLKSDASGTASIGNSAGTISGNVNVERFIPRRRAFRFLASPVNTTNFISGSWQQATHITGSLTGANGFDQSNSGTASLFTYNVGTEAWTAIPNTNSTNLNIGTGYRMLVRGDRNINLNTTTPQDSAALVLSATGSIVTGDVVFGAGSVSSSPAGIPALNSAIGSGDNNSTVGWSLIGNPYASAVNWASVTKSNVSTTFATWNVNNAGRGSYVYHNGSAGTGNGASNIINSGQSVFVQTTAANPSITFTEASKVSSTPPSHFKKSLSDVLNIDIFIGDRAYDGLAVLFDVNNSNEYDVQDFIKLVNPEINFYSYLADGTKLAMNNMKEIGAETIVPLGLNGVFNGGSYELKFSNQNTFSNSEVYLKDKFINKTYDLKSINNLTFTVTTDSNSFGENRFELIFSKSATGLNNELSSNNNNFIVFPNPANNLLNLSLTTTKEDNYSYSIFNQLGAEVSNGNLDFNSKRTHALNIENLNSGVYFIQVKNGKSTQTIKFIK
ncbi:MAG: T9SS type A sorting domain-containing protein, partial [Bacteroidia bacterium]